MHSTTENSDTENSDAHRRPPTRSPLLPRSAPRVASR